MEAGQVLKNRMWTLGEGLLLAGLSVMVAWLSVRRGGTDTAVLVFGGAAALVLMLAPSRWMLSCFVLLMMAGHQFRSPLIYPLAGVEWHPRELLLLLLLAHFAVKVMTGEADLRPDIMHYFVLCYAAFFAVIACRGIWRQMPIQDVIAECRYPIFLAAYFVFVACAGGARELPNYLRLMLYFSVGIALLSIAYFLYAFATGHVVSIQNWLGEFVQRRIGPFLLQSVRANGHMFYEVCVVVLAALILCPDTPQRRRALYTALIGLFLIAIVITMMRTAYAALFLSLLVLAVLFLPAELQMIAGFLGAVAAVGCVVAGGVLLSGNALIPGLETSLQGRFVEISGALDMFKQYPLLGAGMGSKFTGLGFVSKTAIRSVAQADFQTVHNVWMYFLFKGGLAGMFLVGLGLGGLVLRAHRTIGALSSRSDQYLMRGLLAALCGQLAASLTMPRLTYPNGAVFLSMMACAFVMMTRHDGPAALAPSSENGYTPREKTSADGERISNHD